MNDVARFRWHNITHETIVFQREKTKRTKKDSAVKIVALRNKHINTIIERWGKKDFANSNTFVFSIIDEYDNAEVVRKKIQQFIHVINYWMKKMGRISRIRLKTNYIRGPTLICNNFGAEQCSAGSSKPNPGHSNITTTQKIFCWI